MRILSCLFASETCVYASANRLVGLVFVAILALLVYWAGCSVVAIFYGSFALPTMIYLVLTGKNNLKDCDWGEAGQVLAGFLYLPVAWYVIPVVGRGFLAVT